MTEIWEQSRSWCLGGGLSPGHSSVNTRVQKSITVGEKSLQTDHINFPAQSLSNVLMFYLLTFRESSQVFKSSSTVLIAGQNLLYWQRGHKCVDSRCNMTNTSDCTKANKGAVPLGRLCWSPCRSQSPVSALLTATLLTAIRSALRTAAVPCSVPPRSSPHRAPYCRGPENWAQWLSILRWHP